MKKIMIAMFVAAISAMSFASTVKWTAQNVYAPETTTKITGTAAYFFLTADTSNIYANSIVDQATIVSAIAGGNWDGTGSLGGKYTTAGTLLEGAVIADIDGTGSSYTVSGFVVFLDTADYATATQYMVTDVKTSAAITSSSGTKNIVFGNQAGNAWQSIESSSVPEPTSALMLLVGLAGLALKRKVA